jgi:hypothetical protein
VVSPYPRLRRPVVGPDLYACGRVVPAANLAPSTHVEVWDDDTGEVIGTGETTNYPRIAGVLEELGYSGTVGLEAYASEDDELALERFRSAFTTRSAVGQVAGT